MAQFMTSLQKIFAYFKIHATLKLNFVFLERFHKQVKLPQNNNKLR